MGTEARKTQRFILVLVKPEDNLLGFKDSVCVCVGGGSIAEVETKMVQPCPVFLLGGLDRRKMGVERQIRVRMAEGDCHPLPHLGTGGQL